MVFRDVVSDGTTRLTGGLPKADPAYLIENTLSVPEFRPPNDSAWRRPTGLDIVFESPGPSAVWNMSFSLDVETQAASVFAIAYVYLDGSSFGPAAVMMNPNGSLRNALGKSKRIAGLSAGPHTASVMVTSQSTGLIAIYSHSMTQLQRIS